MSPFNNVDGRPLLLEGFVFQPSRAPTHDLTHDAENVWARIDDVRLKTNHFGSLLSCFSHERFLTFPVHLIFPPIEKRKGALYLFFLDFFLKNSSLSFHNKEMPAVCVLTMGITYGHWTFYFWTTLTS